MIKASNMFKMKSHLIILFFYLFSFSGANRWYRMFNSNHDDPCLDRHKRFQRCIPDFVNAAYQKSIYISASCSNSPKEFCNPTSISTSDPTDLLTDLNNPNNLTCWQSDAMKNGENISLILPLKKKFELTYISLQFCSSSKPDSIAIYKSMDMVSRINRCSSTSFQLSSRVSLGSHYNTIRTIVKEFLIKHRKKS